MWRLYYIEVGIKWSGIWVKSAEEIIGILMEDLDMADSSEYNASTSINFTRHKGQIFRRLVLIVVREREVRLWKKEKKKWMMSRLKKNHKTEYLELFSITYDYSA